MVWGGFSSRRWAPREVRQRSRLSWLLFRRAQKAAMGGSWGWSLCVQTMSLRIHGWNCASRSFLGKYYFIIQCVHIIKLNECASLCEWVLVYMAVCIYYCTGNYIFYPISISLFICVIYSLSDPSDKEDWCRWEYTFRRGLGIPLKVDLYASLSTSLSASLMSLCCQCIYFVYVHTLCAWGRGNKLY